VNACLRALEGRARILTPILWVPSFFLLFSRFIGEQIDVMRNQVTTLQKHPPVEFTVHPWREAHAPSVAMEDRSPNFRGSARGLTNQEAGQPIRRILVPTDFSPRSARAVERAAELARQSGATVTILHVIDINPSAAPTHCGTAEDLIRQLWTAGTSELERLKESMKKNQTRVRTLMVEGLPYEAIVENSSGFDLLVISEPRPKSAWNFFSKQTARRVIEQAKCPVHVVRQETGLAGRSLRSEAKLAA
jgi:nucleotide-binding universal stress UspA family protein